MNNGGQPQYTILHGDKWGLIWWGLPNSTRLMAPGPVDHSVRFPYYESLWGVQCKCGFGLSFWMVSRGVTQLFFFSIRLITDSTGWASQVAVHVCLWQSSYFLRSLDPLSFGSVPTSTLFRYRMQPSLMGDLCSCAAKCIYAVHHKLILSCFFLTSRTL